MGGPEMRAKTGATMGDAPIGRPWYVQFWPLFLVFLMVASIGGSLATVAIAYRHADVDVRTAEASAESPR